MSTLIPNYQIEELKQLNPEQWPQLKSAEIWLDQKEIGFLIVPRTDYVQAQAERFALLSNTVGGVELADLLLTIKEVDKTITCKVCGRHFKANIGLISHRRKHKEAVGV